jgi:hypothetical protein
MSLGSTEKEQPTVGVVANPSRRCADLGPWAPQSRFLCGNGGMGFAEIQRKKIMYIRPIVRNQDTDEQCHLIAGYRRHREVNCEHDFWSADGEPGRV